MLQHSSVDTSEDEADDPDIVIHDIIDVHVLFVQLKNLYVYLIEINKLNEENSIHVYIPLLYCC